MRLIHVPGMAKGQWKAAGWIFYKDERKTVKDRKRKYRQREDSLLRVRVRVRKSCPACVEQGLAKACQARPEPWCKGYCKKHAREKGLEKPKRTLKVRRHAKGKSIRKGSKASARGSLAETPRQRTYGREIKDGEDEKDEEDEKHEKHEKDDKHEVTPPSRRQPAQEEKLSSPITHHPAASPRRKAHHPAGEEKLPPITQRDKKKGMQRNVPQIPKSWR